MQTALSRNLTLTGKRYRAESGGHSTEIVYLCVFKLEKSRLHLNAGGKQIGVRDLKESTMDGESLQES